MGVVNASRRSCPSCSYGWVLRAPWSAPGRLPAIAGCSSPADRRWLQGKRNIVPWYSRSRLVATSGMRIGVAVVTASPEWATAGDRHLGLATLPLTAALVSFPIVMDVAAGRPAVRAPEPALGHHGPHNCDHRGPRGQFSPRGVPAELRTPLRGVLDRRIASFWFSRQIRSPTSPPSRGATTCRRGSDCATSWRSWREERPLIATRRGVHRERVDRDDAPLVPLFYVREVGAPDAWIGASRRAGRRDARRVPRRPTGLAPPWWPLGAPSVPPRRCPLPPRPRASCRSSSQLPSSPWSRASSPPG